MNCDVCRLYRFPSFKLFTLILRWEPLFQGSISAPSACSASTSGWMGRSCIRLDPSVSIPSQQGRRSEPWRSGTFDVMFELELNASTSTWVSSQSEVFIGWLLRLRALRISARLLNSSGGQLHGGLNYLGRENLNCFCIVTSYL